MKKNTFRLWRKQILILAGLFALAAGVIYKNGAKAVGTIFGDTEASVYAVIKKTGMCRIYSFDRYCRENMFPAGINFGVYDPEGSFAGQTSMAVDHYFIDWIKYDQTEMVKNLQASIAKNRWPLITIESWAEEGKKDTLLADIANGEYDGQIEKICGDIGSINNPVFIRWGHEMEIVSGRYPWAVSDGQIYQQAYKHVVNKCRENIGQAYWVWSPAGSKGLEKYWPGGENVDYVGLSVYAFDEFDQKNYGRRLAFEEIFADKYGRVKGYNKPVIIAEMGVNGSREQQEWWMKGFYAGADNYPLLKTAVYFNAGDSAEAWGQEYSVPDWRISPQVFAGK